MSGSVRRRLVLFLAIPLMVLKFFDALYYYATLAKPSREGDERLQLSAQLIGAELAATPPATWPTAASQLVSELSTSHRLIYSVRDASGRLIGGDASVPTAPHTGASAFSYADPPFSGGHGRLLSYRAETPAGTLAITVSAPTTSSTDTLPAWRHLAWDFFDLDITLLLIWLGVHFGLRPIENLRREIDARSADDLQPIQLRSVPSELRPFLRSLNRLLGMVNSSLSGQSQFVADAAHQLRTPIASLAAQLDVLIADSRQVIDRPRLMRLDSSLKQLTRSANQLLTLSRATSALTRLDKHSAVDLKAVVINAAERMIDRAIKLNIELSADAQSAVVVADPSLIDEMLGNLLDNALNHTPADGEVTLHSGLLDHQPFLMIDDTGCGIPAGERKRVLERFYRSPTSLGSGTGLGLAIVDEIARLYSAKLTIEVPPNGQGTRVRIVWPAQEPT